MITLHHLNNSRSQRILWLLEELGLEYETQTHYRDPKTGLAPQSLRDIFPLGRSPVLTIQANEQSEPIVLAESGAIVEYLCQQYNEKQLCVNADENVFKGYLFWMHFTEGTLMPPLIANLVMGKAKAKKKPIFVNAIANKVIDAILDAYYNPNHATNIALVKAHLVQQRANGSEFMIGDRLTAVDIMMLFPLEALVATGSNNIDSSIKHYVQTMQSRPAYQAALVRGGEYDFGPKDKVA